MKYLDASVPLCSIIEEPIKYAERSKRIMLEIESGRLLAVTSVLTIMEIYHILKKREKYTAIDVKERVLALLDCIGFKVIDAEAELSKNAIELATAYEIDPVDSHNYLVMKKYNINEIYSFDQHYDKFKDIRRIF